MLSGVIVALVIGLAAASTFAHDGHGIAVGAPMAALDANHDGTISAVEHAAYAHNVFDSMDTNHDGTLSEPELAAGMKVRHARTAATGAWHAQQERVALAK